MAYIQKIKRKKGIAYNVFYYVDGVRKTKYFPARTPYKQVKMFIEEIELNYVEEFDYTTPKQITLDELARIYNDSRSSEVNTWREIISLNGLIKYLSPHRKLENINHLVIHKYRDELLAKRLKTINENDYVLVQKARRGVNKELVFLRVVFRWAYKNDLISQPIFDKVSMFKASKPLPDVLTKDEDKAFYKALRSFGDKKLRLAYWILKYTGVRRSELVALKWHDFDVKLG